MAIDVLDGNNGIIDHTGKRQRQSTEDHCVDRRVAELQQNECRQNGNRDRKKNGRGGPEISQEQQNHEARHGQADKAFVQNRLDGLLHEDRLIEKKIGFHLLWDIVQVSKQVGYTVYDLNRVRIAALLQNRNVGGFLPGHSHDVVLSGIGVFGLADVADADPGIPYGFQGNIVQLRHVIDQTVGIQVLIERTHFYVAGGQDQVLVVHGAHNVHYAEVPRHQFIRIDANHDLPVLSAERGGDRHTRDRHYLITNGELGKVVKLSFIQAQSADGYPANQIRRMPC